MKTILITHSDCDNHEATGHPERPERLQAVLKLISASGLEDDLETVQAQEVARELLTRVHPASYVSNIEAIAPDRESETQAESPGSQQHDNVWLDPDTYMSAGSLRAARLAAGSCVQAVDRVLARTADNAFCAIRPPGHHAEIAAPLGFCIFNNIAIAAEHALQHEGINRIAILDFDVHHCNGTVDIFKDRNEVLVCSSFQDPFYPNRYNNYFNDHIIISPLAEGSGSADFRTSVDRDWTPAIEAHKPDFIFVSAGFDAHRDDPVGGLNFSNDDFLWVTELIREYARSFAQDRLVSTLEGGYDLTALANSTLVHLSALRA
jgi:acetoin utilization deacetylase AcuC-like enzyme